MHYSRSSSKQTWTISLTDTSTGASFTKTGVKTYASSLLSADWIEERPEVCALFAA